jgi:hypothetical protein
LELLYSSNHSLLLISYEALRGTVHLNECLKYIRKCIGCFEASDGNGKGDNAVETVYSSKDSDGILMVVISSLLDDIVGQVITHDLAIQLK